MLNGWIVSELVIESLNEKPGRDQWLILKCLSRVTFDMSSNRRIFLNIVATYGRSLDALVWGLAISRWKLEALDKTDLGLNDDGR